MADGIFVSYRRDDAKHAAGRLFERLSGTFSADQLFLDVEQIEPGLDFKCVISENVQACAVLLAVIGPDWLNSVDGQGRRRLDNSEDFVRIEIEAALARNIRIIPVLLDGAQMPSEHDLPASISRLSSLQAVTVRHERFAADVDGLIKHLTKVVGRRANQQRMATPRVSAFPGPPPLSSPAIWVPRPSPRPKTPNPAGLKKRKNFPWFLMAFSIGVSLIVLYFSFAFAASAKILFYLVIAPPVVAAARHVLRDHRMAHADWEITLNFVAAICAFVLLTGVAAVALDLSMFGRASAFIGMFAGAAVALIATIVVWFFINFVEP